MCLNLNNTYAKRLRCWRPFGMTVYKYVLMTGGGCMITPFFGMGVKPGMLARSVLRVKAACVHEGLHSYARLEDAKQHAVDRFYRIALVECRIPFGAKYYAGTTMSRDGYASNRLRYVKIVETIDQLK